MLDATIRPERVTIVSETKKSAEREGGRGEREKKKSRGEEGAKQEVRQPLTRRAEEEMEEVEKQ